MTDRMTKLANEHFHALCAIDFTRMLYPELEERLLAQRYRLHAQQVVSVPPAGRKAYLARLRHLRRMHRYAG